MREEEWKALYQAFDPWTPAVGAIRADRRRWSPIDRIRRELGRGSGQRRFLVMGPPGAGKTTELLRLAEDRAAQSCVVSIDLWRHFQDQMKDAHAIERVQSWEVIVLVALAVYRAGEAQLGPWSPVHERALREAIAKLRGIAPEDASLDLGKLAGGLVVLTSVVGGIVAGPPGAAAGALGASALKEVAGGLKELAAAFQWKLPLGTSTSQARDDQDAPVNALINATNALIAEIQTRHRPILLVVDGLDRVTEETTMRGLFLDSALLGRLEASTVLTGPLALLRGGLARQVRGFEACPLDNVPVLDLDDPNRPGPGVVFFRDMARRRGAGEVLPETVVDRLAWASGGIVRDFLKLVQRTLAAMFDRANEANAPVGDRAETADAEQAIEDERRLIELGLTREDLDLLAAVANDPHHELPDAPRAARLLTTFCLLPFPNGSQWWYPHPLLTLVLLRRRTGSIA